MRIWRNVPEVRTAYENGKDFTSVDLRNIIFEPDEERLLDLKGTDFRGCDLSSVEFYSCDLQGADFTGASLEGCVFTECYFGNRLFGSKLELKGWDFRAVIYRTHNPCDYIEKYKKGLFFNISNIRMPLDTGGQDLIGYKVLMKIYANKDAEMVIAKLFIPADSRRIVFEDDKCRCERAKVLEIYSLDKENYYGSAQSYMHNIHLTYTVGKEVCADSFDENASVVCTHGIHFFLTEEEAIDFGEGY